MLNYSYLMNLLNQIKEKTSESGRMLKPPPFSFFMAKFMLSVEEPPVVNTSAPPQSTVRVFNGHSFFVPPGDAKRTRMSNPAIAVLGCRRMDMLERIVRSLSAMVLLRTTVFTSL